MCERVELIPEKNRATVHSARAVALLRLPDYASDRVGGAGLPESQCVKLGEIVCNILEELRVHGRLTDS